MPRRAVSCQPGYSGRWCGPLRCEAGRPHLRKRTLFAEISAAGISACAWLGAPRRSRPHPPSARALLRHRGTPSGAVGHGRARCPPVQALAPLPLHPARAARHGRQQWAGRTRRRCGRVGRRDSRALRARSTASAYAPNHRAGLVWWTHARWDVPRPRAAHSGYFEGSRPRSQRGGWRRPASSRAACTGPSRYSTHKVGLEDMSR